MLNGQIARRSSCWRKPIRISGFKSDLKRTKSQESYLNQILECINEPSIRRNNLIQKHLFQHYPRCDGYFIHYDHFEHETRGVYSLSYSKCGKYIVIGFGNGSIKLLNRETWKPQVFLKGSKIGLPINSIKFSKSSDSSYFFAGSENGTISVGTVSPHSYVTFAQETGNAIYTMDLDKKAENLLTAGEDSVIRVYDCNTNQKKRELSGHENRIYCVRMNPDDDNCFVSGGLDRTLKFWDLRSNKCLLKSEKSCMLFGDGIDVKNGVLAIVSWEEPPGQIWDMREMRKVKDITPKNRKVQKTGSLTLCGKFFHANSDSADLFMAGSMGHGSMVFYSLKEEAVLHAFVANETIICIDSRGHEVAFGGKQMGLYIVEFFPDIDSFESVDSSSSYSDYQDSD
ncbi:lissencephaly-1 homolog [Nilaparvata lugens]|uniref:lissencephaly-1 homolog n=1 Tax=Nilaparvata lugens TaxID=108931 RepID=UPI00193E60BA|nr:lissencephaly-1 homolog [Nilaparvata lugens]